MFPDDKQVGFNVFWAWQLVAFCLSLVVSKFVTRITVADWYTKIFLYGARPIAVALFRSVERQWIKELCVLWFCVCIKYLYPFLMYRLLIFKLKQDLVETTTVAYHEGWHWIGMIVPVFGLLLFLIPLIRYSEEPGGDSFNQAFINYSNECGKPKETNSSRVKPQPSEVQLSEN